MTMSSTLKHPDNKSACKADSSPRSDIDFLSSGSATSPVSSVSVTSNGSSATSGIAPSTCHPQNDLVDYKKYVELSLKLREQFEIQENMILAYEINIRKSQYDNLKEIFGDVARNTAALSKHIDDLLAANTADYAMELTEPENGLVATPGEPDAVSLSTDVNSLVTPSPNTSSAAQEMRTPPEIPKNTGSDSSKQPNTSQSASLVTKEKECAPMKEAPKNHQKSKKNRRSKANDKAVKGTEPLSKPTDGLSADKSAARATELTETGIGLVASPGEEKDAASLPTYGMSHVTPSPKISSSGEKMHTALDSGESSSSKSSKQPHESQSANLVIKEKGGSSMKEAPKKTQKSKNDSPAKTHDKAAKDTKAMSKPTDGLSAVKPSTHATELTDPSIGLVATPGENDSVPLSKDVKSHVTSPAKTSSSVNSTPGEQKHTASNSNKNPSSDSSKQTETSQSDSSDTDEEDEDESEEEWSLEKAIEKYVYEQTMKLVRRYARDIDIKYGIKDYKARLESGRDAFRRNQVELAKNDRDEHDHQLSLLTPFDRFVVSTFGGAVKHNKQTNERARKFAVVRAGIHRRLNNETEMIQWNMMSWNLNEALVEDLLWLSKFFREFNFSDEESLKYEAIYRSIVFSDNKDAFMELPIDEITTEDKSLRVEELRLYLRRRAIWIANGPTCSKSKHLRLTSQEKLLYEMQKYSECLDPIRTRAHWKSIETQMKQSKQGHMKTLAPFAGFIAGIPSHVLGTDVGCLLQLIEQARARNRTMDPEEVLLFASSAYLRNAFQVRIAGF